MKLRPGKYKIEISRLGFMTYRKTVRVVLRARRVMKAYRAVAGVVVLQSNVPGAEVLVKGENVGTVDAPIEIGIGRVERRSSHLVMRSSRWQWKGSRGLSARFAWLRRLAGLSSMRWPSICQATSRLLSLDLELDMPSEGDTAPELVLDLEPEPEQSAAPDIAAQAVAPIPG